MEIDAWLRRLGLERYEPVFREHEIDADVVAELSEGDLEKLGVPLGPRKKLLKAIDELRAAANEGGTADIPEAGSARAAERRQLTVLFCDLVGSTELARRLDPEDLSGIIRSYQAAVTREINRFGGVVAKFMGDGVLAYFGWPQAHEDDAERAVRAGLAAQEAITRTAGAEALSARIGIATGLVVVGHLVGNGAAREEAVVGETPNLAARLQQLAQPGTVVVAGSTRRLLGRLFELDDLGAHRVKGFAEPVSAWRVLGEGSSESRFEARQGATPLPVIGREQELALLLDRWSIACRGEGQTVLLPGEAGIGKSRIVQALRERLAGDPHVSLRYFCSPYHAGSALYPVVAQLERAAGIARGDSPSTRVTKLEALLAREGSRTDEVLPALADVLGIRTGETGGAELTPQQRRTRGFRALLSRLEGLAVDQPVLVILEDAHWLDPTSLELFGMIVDRIQRLPVLLVITCRPAFEPPWRGYPHVTELSLNRLTRTQAQAMVEHLSGGGRLSPELLELIVGKTEGVPLFIEELTKSVLESGDGRSAKDDRHTVGPRSLAVPMTLQDSLMARLDRLASAKKVAQLGACIGREFDHELLVAVAWRPARELNAALAELVRAELLFRRGTAPEATYSFKHALVQDAAYQSLLRSRRREMHARIGRALEERFPALADAQPSLVAHHLTEGGQAGDAVPFWLRAGQQENERGASTEAANHLYRGLDLMGAIPDETERVRLELELLTTLGCVLNAGMGYGDPEVGRVYGRARELCDHLADRRQMFAVLLGLAIHHAVRAELETAKELGGRLQVLADEGRDPVLLVEACYAVGIVHSWLGEFAAALRHLERGMRLYDVAQHRAHLALYGQDGGPVCLCRSGMALWYLGYPDQALTRMKEALALTERLEHPFSRAYILGWAAILQVHRRDVERAESAVETLLACLAEHAFPFWDTQAELMKGWITAERGRLAAGIELMEKGLSGLRKIGSDTILPWALGLIAEAFGKAGRLTEGGSLVDEALGRAISSGARWCEPDLHRVRGELHLLHPDRGSGPADASFHRALDLAQRQDARMWELRAATSLARLRVSQGQHAQARDLLGPVHGTFDEGFDTADLQTAKALLMQLA